MTQIKTATGLFSWKPQFTTCRPLPPVSAFVLMLCMAHTVLAIPQAFEQAHVYHHFDVNALPGWAVGQKIQLFTAVESSDPRNSPQLGATARQGDTTIDLMRLTGPIFEQYPGVHVFYALVDVDPNLSGAWQIVPRDSTGVGPPVFTNPLLNPQSLPFIHSIGVAGSNTSLNIQWTLPDLSTFDADNVFIRAIEVETGTQVFGSPLIDFESDSYQLPDNSLQTGVDYVFSVNIVDFNSGLLANTATTFSMPFRLTTAGDYNQDGFVDAADYTTWRDNLGTHSLINRGTNISGPVSDADYQVWRESFGVQFEFAPVKGAGQSTSIAIPEPSAVVLVALACVACFRRHNRKLRH